MAITRHFPLPGGAGATEASLVVADYTQNIPVPAGCLFWEAYAIGGGGSGAALSIREVTVPYTVIRGGCGGQIRRTGRRPRSDIPGATLLAVIGTGGGRVSAIPTGTGTYTATEGTPGGNTVLSIGGVPLLTALGGVGGGFGAGGPGAPNPADPLVTYPAWDAIEATVDAPGHAAHGASMGSYNAVNSYVGGYGGRGLGTGSGAGGYTGSTATHPGGSVFRGGSFDFLSLSLPVSYPQVVYTTASDQVYVPGGGRATGCGQNGYQPGSGGSGSIVHPGSVTSNAYKAPVAGITGRTPTPELCSTSVAYTSGPGGCYGAGGAAIARYSTANVTIYSGAGAPGAIAIMFLIAGE